MEQTTSLVTNGWVLWGRASEQHGGSLATICGLNKVIERLPHSDAAMPDRALTSQCLGRCERKEKVPISRPFGPIGTL